MAMLREAVERREEYQVQWTPDGDAKAWRDEQGRSILFLAIFVGYLPIFLILLSKVGEDFDFAVEDKTPLWYILERYDQGELDKETATKMLIELCKRFGKNLGTKYPNLLPRLAHRGLYEVIISIKEEGLIEDWTSQQCDCITDLCCYNFLTIAAEDGELNFLKRVYDLDPSVINTTDGNERTMMHLAAYAGKSDVVLWLLENGANPNLRDDQDNTPLNDAVNGFHDSFEPELEEVDSYRKIIQLLLDNAGEDIATKNGEILGHAISFQDTFLLDLILGGNYGYSKIDLSDYVLYGENLITQALKYLDLDKMEYIIYIIDRCRSIINIENRGLFPIDRAVMLGDVDLVKELVSNFQVNVRSRNSSGKYPFHYVNSVEMLKFLIRIGSPVIDSRNGNPNRDNMGRTLLHIACSNGYREIVEYCLDHGFRVDDVDDFHRDALWHLGNVYDQIGFPQAIPVDENKLAIRRILEDQAYPEPIDNSGRVFRDHPDLPWRVGPNP